jgi:hypothetical protein
MEELMPGVSLPMRWLATAGDYDARKKAGAGCARNCGGEMHEQGNRAEHARGMMDQENQVAYARATAKIEHAAQGWMIVSALSNLDKPKPIGKMVDDCLPAAAMPPLDREVVFSSGGD